MKWRPIAVDGYDYTEKRRWCCNGRVLTHASWQRNCARLPSCGGLSAGTARSASARELYLGDQRMIHRNGALALQRSCEAFAPNANIRSSENAPEESRAFLRDLRNESAS